MPNLTRHRGMVQKMQKEFPEFYLHVDSGATKFTEHFEDGENEWVIEWKKAEGNGPVHKLTTTTEHHTNETRALKIMTSCVHWENEIRAMILLNSKPHFVKFYGYWGDSCTLYLLTEYIEGGDLGKRIGPHAEQKSPLGELTIKAIAKQVLEGTVTMHLMDIIHRDLSPPNIIGPFENVRIVNMDIAVQIDELGEIGKLGHPGYIAPEAVAEIESYYKPVDLWSIGCLVYAMFLGVSPFPTNNDTPKRGSDAKATLDEDKLSDAGASKNAIDFINCLLRVNPRLRPTAAAALKHKWFTEK